MTGSGTPLAELRVDGGAARWFSMLQRQADQLRHRPSPDRRDHRPGRGTARRSRRGRVPRCRCRRAAADLMRPSNRQTVSDVRRGRLRPMASLVERSMAGPNSPQPDPREVSALGEVSALSDREHDECVDDARGRRRARLFVDGSTPPIASVRPRAEAHAQHIGRRCRPRRPRRGARCRRRTRRSTRRSGPGRPEDLAVTETAHPVGSKAGISPALACRPDRSSRPPGRPAEQRHRRSGCRGRRL